MVMRENPDKKIIIVDNDYITFPYKIGIDICIGSCNSKNNSYFKVCLPDFIKNITVRSLDLISRKLVFKSISFHKNCKCGCLLDEKVCHNLQKWNGKKCRCECLIVKKCKTGYSWNFNNCRCEMKKLAALAIETEKCDIKTDEIKCEAFSKNISKCKTFPKNKTLIKKIENCKPFVGIHILFLLFH